MVLLLYPSHRTIGGIERSERMEGLVGRTLLIYLMNGYYGVQY